LTYKIESLDEEVSWVEYYLQDGPKKRLPDETFPSDGEDAEFSKSLPG
jgi:hypothetical protein